MENWCLQPVEALTAGRETHSSTEKQAEDSARPRRQLHGEGAEPGRRRRSQGAAPSRWAGREETLRGQEARRRGSSDPLQRELEDSSELRCEGGLRWLYKVATRSGSWQERTGTRESGDLPSARDSAAMPVPEED